jgi:hypothetical protein
LYKIEEVPAARDPLAGCGEASDRASLKLAMTPAARPGSTLASAGESDRPARIGHYPVKPTRTGQRFFNHLRPENRRSLDIIPVVSNDISCYNRRHLS